MSKASKTAGQTAPAYKTFGSFLASDTGKTVLTQFQTVIANENDVLVQKLAVCGLAMGQAWKHFSATTPGSNKPHLVIEAKSIAEDLAKALSLEPSSLRVYLSTVNRGIDARSNTLNEKLREACLAGDVLKVTTELKAIGKTFADIRSVLSPKKAGKKGAKKLGKRAAAVARFTKAGAALDMNSLRQAIDALAVEFGLTSALVAMWTAGKKAKKAKA